MSNVYHVTPRDERWIARLQGSPTPSATADTREEAVRLAERFLRQLGSGRVVVHGADGRIENVHTLQDLAGQQDSGGAFRPSRSLWVGVLAAGCLIGVGLAMRARR